MHDWSDLDSPQTLLDEIAGLREYLLALCESLHVRTQGLDASQVKSAKNLLHYVALRAHDIRPLQQHLARLGLSSLGRAEPHVMATIDAVYHALHVLVNRRESSSHAECAHVSVAEARALLETKTVKLLGDRPMQRGTRIMVTLPSEAAHNPGLIEALLSAGMNCARINCAHDDAEKWHAMIVNLREAERRLGVSCKILMDLGGPKLRTGPVTGVQIKKARTERDLSGHVLRPAHIWLVCEGTHFQPAQGGVVVPVPGEFLAALDAGSRLLLQDARGVQRVLEARERHGEALLAVCEHNCYIRSGAELRLEGTDLKAGVGALPIVEEPLRLKSRDTLYLTRSLELGQPALMDAAGRVVQPARIGCTLPQIFEQVKSGEPVWFDDGKFAGVIREASAESLRIEITQMPPGGGKLRGDKGINFPESALTVPALTEKDLRDLEFAAAHADMIGLSFCQNPRDVEDLHERLKALANRPVGIVLKIETRRAFQQLPELLLAAMHSPLAGVMIARGDLAIECGFERLAEVQEEVLWICEAAHIPVVWATQVLESAAKSGQPSRAEITDAAMSSRAECVMLNKGPHIADAVRILDDILRRMGDHQDKKRALLRRLSSWAPLVS
jgi:pyruvate kinase